ncbi:hypothetical protein SAMN05518849_1144 [Sphingobium sp. AP50]|nr:hypothetical protein SAMN05518849_1144 [Sphingobium sp. AP50]
MLGHQPYTVLDRTAYLGILLTCMRPLSDLSSPNWTGKLARALEQSASAIARLDARVSVSPVAKAWFERASWTGYASALRGQSVEIEEIDIFGQSCGVSIPGRQAPATRGYDASGLAGWQAFLRDRTERHWRDDAPFSTVTADDWNNRSALLRSLEILSRHARADPSIAPWLAFPHLLQSMGATSTPLPCLVHADKALRYSPRDADANITRYFRLMTAAAEAGLQRLAAMEEHRVLSVMTTRESLRPGKLGPLLALLQYRPVISPRFAAVRLGISISGAGKLLTRAADRELVIEISGRQAWRTYIVKDLAYAFGLAKRPVGRPIELRQRLEPLDPALLRFDAEMADLDATLSRLGISAPVDDDSRAPVE